MNAVDAQLLDLDAGKYDVLSITDTGCGMDEATKEKIFDPFYSTKGEKGTGLGLSQVYGFVERSDGVIRVTTELGYGTCFNLFFPQYQIRKGKEKSKNINIELASGGNETILIVDDESTLVFFLKQGLQESGIECLVDDAGSGEEALTKLTYNRYDVLVTDLKMPGISGFTLLEVARSLHTGINIILMTAFGSPEVQDEAKRLEVDGYLTKPFLTAELQSIIIEVLTTKSILESRKEQNLHNLVSEQKSDWEPTKDSI